MTGSRGAASAQCNEPSGYISKGGQFIDDLNDCLPSSSGPCFVELRGRDPDFKATRSTAVTCQWRDVTAEWLALCFVFGRRRVQMPSWLRNLSWLRVLLIFLSPSKAKYRDSTPKCRDPLPKYGVNSRTILLYTWLMCAVKQPKNNIIRWCYFDKQGDTTLDIRSF
jgi:hypothetical protein